MTGKISSPVQPQNYMGYPLWQRVNVPVDLITIGHIKHTDSQTREINDEELLALAQSIEADREFLLVRYPFVNTFPGREGIVIGGDKRMMAVEKLGWKKIPVMFVYVDPDKETAWNLKDNDHAGRWNEEQRARAIMKLSGTGFNMKTMGIVPKKLTSYLGDFGKTKKSEDPNYHGTTPSKKGKAAFGATVECPNCGSRFGFAEEHIIAEENKEAGG